VLIVRIESHRLAKPVVRRVICSSPNDGVSCEHRKCKKMVYPAAIREKSQRGVALSWDAHVMSASQVEYGSRAFRSLGFLNLCRTFLIDQHFCAGNSCRSASMCGLYIRG